MLKKVMESNQRPKIISGVPALIYLFREAILSLVPVLEKAKIPWREIDLFDDVCESIFQIIVQPKIESYFLSKQTEAPPLAKYGYFYKDYFKTGYIEVIPEKVEHPSGIYVFVMFTSKKQPFDTVVCNLIDEKGNVLKRDVEIPYDEVSFRFRYQSSKGETYIIK